MNILAIIDFNQIIYNLMTGIYSMVAHVYDLMLDLVEASNFNKLGIDFSNTIEPFYVLAGIFMLFRIVVSFLNYIVEPDKVSSSDVGAGKMITRVLVSIILLLLLRPGHSIIYNFLDDIQDALLAPDGLIANIAGQDYKLKNNKESLVPNVNAADVLTCYYDIERKETNINSMTMATKYYHQVYLKLVISKKGSGISAKFEDAKIQYTENGKTKTVKTAKVINPKFDYGNYSFNNGCPYIIINPALPIPKDDDLITSVKDKTFNFVTSNALEKTALRNSVGRPKNSLKEAVDETKKKDDAVLSTVDNGDGNNQHLFKHYAIAASDEALDFTSSMGKSFLTCNIDKDFSKKECKGLLDDMFRGGDDEIVDAINDSKISFSSLPAIIVGIVLIVFLLVLCVDVVVRGFKMFLLQMIAPIPIVSYINPKDKMLSEWTKMYAATYLNLFLQLIAIKVGCVFLNILCENSKFAGLEKVFWAIGILVFIKMVPSMISKIFGIDLAGGTLKDSMGMLKAGLGFGAGAVAGAGAGLVGAAVAFSGTKGQNWKQRALAGARGVGGAFGSTFRGAGAGSKNGIAGVTKNAKSSFAKSWDRRQLYKNGLDEGTLLAGSLAGGAMSYAARVDRDNQAKKDKVDSLDKFTKFKGAIEDTAESGKFMKTLRQKVATGALNLNENTLQDYRDTWVEYQIAMNSIKTSDSFVQRKAQLEAQVSAGNMTEAQMNNQLDSIIRYELNTQHDNLQTRVDTISRKTNVAVEVEAGKQSGIVSTMEQANATLKNTGDVRETAGVDHVASFGDLKNANTKVKKESTKIHDEIFASTEASDKYNASKAAQDIAKNDKK